MRPSGLGVRIPRGYDQSCLVAHSVLGFDSPNGLTHGTREVPLWWRPTLRGDWRGERGPHPLAGRAVTGMDEASRTSAPPCAERGRAGQPVRVERAPARRRAARPRSAVVSEARRERPPGLARGDSGGERGPGRRPAARSRGWKKRRARRRRPARSAGARARPRRTRPCPPP